MTPIKLFAATDRPRLFAMPPGRDFAADFVAGLRHRLTGHPPEAAASIMVFLSTRRLRQGINDEYCNGPPGFLPRLRLITDLARDPSFPDLPPPVNPLRRRLELAQAVGKLLEGDERFGSRAMVFDLADSLASLLDEMHSEGVSPDTVRSLDVTEHSEHWARSLEFIDIVDRFWELNDQPDSQARLRLVVERLIANWQSNPPSHPVIVAGSTGSRGPTQLLMTAVANLPQGALVVPCLDFEMPPASWDSVTADAGGEDHPQYRLKCLMDKLGVDADSAELWHGTHGRGEARNRLISLALRPPPVTDEWMALGPQLKDIREATEGLTLVEAEDDRQEALAIALCLREAAENGETASLVTPSRDLARAVTAALKRWELVPFDSFGTMLLKTATGRLLHAAAELLGKVPDAVQLIALLRHPSVHRAENRPFHSKMTMEMDRALRNRDSYTCPRTVLEQRHGKANPDSAADTWFQWLVDCLDHLAGAGYGSLAAHAALHEDVVGLLLGGSQSEETGLNWSGADGHAALELFQDIHSAADAAGEMECEDYVHLFKSLAARKRVWIPVSTHPLISIWDTIDARMQSPDLVIAAGLNEGIWPRQPSPDAWLNRQLRRESGLLLPERMTGLRAHDFQQAISARRVVLSRSLRSVDAPTVPSRWLARLVGLLSGLESEGARSLDGMRTRGREILNRARLMEEPRISVAAERRPEPRPPAEARPKRLSVTRIKTLITNPYEIYAQYTLRLQELDPLGRDSLRSHRGMLIHRILELFVDQAMRDDDAFTSKRLMEIAEREFDSADLPDHAKRFWSAQFKNVASDFVAEEKERRQAFGNPWKLEGKGSYTFDDLGFELTARADRIDRAGSQCFLYDYKTGSLPTPKDIHKFDKQIPLTAIMIELGGFEGEGRLEVRRSSYLGVGRDLKTRVVDRVTDDGDLFMLEWTKLQEMLRSYLKESTPFIARRDVRFMKYSNAYHHLARFGEWDDTGSIAGGDDEA